MSTDSLQGTASRVGPRARAGSEEGLQPTPALRLIKQDQETCVSPSLKVQDSPLHLKILGTITYMANLKGQLRFTQMEIRASVTRSTQGHEACGFMACGPGGWAPPFSHVHWGPRVKRRMKIQTNRYKENAHSRLRDLL